MQVMPMIKLDNDDWNATGAKIPDWGTGSQEGFASCRERCGLSGKYPSDHGDNFGNMGADMRTAY